MAGFPLGTRRPDLVEAMDGVACDPDRLDRTYAAFRHVNRLLSGWGRLYRQCIRPRLEHGRPVTILDAGCGGGDLLVRLVNMARKDGFDVSGLGVDPDDRAITWATRAWEGRSDVSFSTATLGELSEPFDVVVSNHVLHHLDDHDARGFLDASLARGRRVVVHNDIARSVTGLVLFQPVGLLFPGTFIRADGTLSIRRSFRQSELSALAGPEWRPVRAAPFRVGLVAEP